MNLIIKPWVFVDLDDTLFQTRRKMSQSIDSRHLRVGAIDRTGQPRSFMSDWQSQFIDWLLSTTELIPVTARDTESLSRVQIPFRSWSITTHGAVIRDDTGTILSSWRQQITKQLSAFITPLLKLESTCTRLFSAYHLDAWARINREYEGMPVYLVIKHKNSHKLDELYRIADLVEAEMDLTGFYRHHNDNNIAWLPNCVHKGAAVRYTLDELVRRHGERATLGFGDSLSDYPFLQHCHWWGTPVNGQLDRHICDSLTTPIASSPRCPKSTSFGDKEETPS